jgi:nitrogen fixation protein
LRRESRLIQDSFALFSNRPRTSTLETFLQTLPNNLSVSSSLRSVPSVPFVPSLSPLLPSVALFHSGSNPLPLTLRLPLSYSPSLCLSQVKIMWPRLDEPAPGVDASQLGARRVGSKAGLTGFVAFMKRKDAEHAIREMDNLDWGGSVLRVGWSKAVPIPRQALYGEPTSSSYPLVGFRCFCRPFCSWTDGLYLIVTVL